MTSIPVPSPARVEASESNAQSATFTQQLPTRLAGFAPITLPEMENVKLLNRVDTKFLMTEAHLLAVLEAIRPNYRILANAGTRATRYRTQYFDMPDFQLYLDHHNDRRDRYKVRCRTYIDSDTTFIEIKHKLKIGRTEKQRKPIPAMPTLLEGDNLAFVRAHFPHNPWRLEPVIWNSFRRITLVSNVRQERLTIDVDLRYGWQDVQEGLSGIVIAEVKQKKFSIDSDFVRELRRRGIYRTGFSKYCAGMAAIYPQLKANRFKRRQLLIDRLLRSGVRRERAY